jgi:hypothetical protein
MTRLDKVRVYGSAFVILLGIAIEAIRRKD